ncbi:MAG TPA: hypothetical protein VFO38_01255 [Candidatus Saccharimonadales bacterium]|nr:hypothetical protein [Candidatus Saccharimonadales bacterium]
MSDEFPEGAVRLGYEAFCEDPGLLAGFECALQDRGYQIRVFREERFGPKRSQILEHGGYLRWATKDPQYQCNSCGHINQRAVVCDGCKQVMLQDGQLRFRLVVTHNDSLFDLWQAPPHALFVPIYEPYLWAPLVESRAVACRLVSVSYLPTLPYALQENDFDLRVQLMKAFLERYTRWDADRLLSFTAKAPRTTRGLMAAVIQFCSV